MLLAVVFTAADLGAWALCPQHSCFNTLSIPHGIVDMTWPLAFRVGTEHEAGQAVTEMAVRWVARPALATPTSSVVQLGHHTAWQIGGTAANSVCNLGVCRPDAGSSHLHSGRSRIWNRRTLLVPKKGNRCRDLAMGWRQLLCVRLVAHLGPAQRCYLPSEKMQNPLHAATLPAWTNVPMQERECLPQAVTYIAARLPEAKRSTPHLRIGFLLIILVILHADVVVGIIH